MKVLQVKSTELGRGHRVADALRLLRQRGLNAESVAAPYFLDRARFHAFVEHSRESARRNRWRWTPSSAACFRWSAAALVAGGAFLLTPGTVASWALAPFRARRAQRVRPRK